MASSFPIMTNRQCESNDRKGMGIMYAAKELINPQCQIQ